MPAKIYPEQHIVAAWSHLTPAELSQGWVIAMISLGRGLDAVRSDSGEPAVFATAHAAEIEIIDGQRERAAEGLDSTRGDYRIMPLTEWRNWQRGWE